MDTRRFFSRKILVAALTAAGLMAVAVPGKGTYFAIRRRPGKYQLQWVNS